MRGDGPVGEAQYRCGPLLGHQVAEGREESPQFRGPRQQLRGLRRQIRWPYRLAGRELAHAPRRSMGRESGHPQGRAGEAPPAPSRPMAAE